MLKLNCLEMVSVSYKTQLFGINVHRNEDFSLLNMGSGGNDGVGEPV